MREGTCDKEAPELWSWTPTDTFLSEAPKCQCAHIEPPSLETEAVPESGYGMGVVRALSNCCGHSTQHCSLLHCPLSASTHKSPHQLQLLSISNTNSFKLKHEKHKSSSLQHAILVLNANDGALIIQLKRSCDMNKPYNASDG